MARLHGHPVPPRIDGPARALLDVWIIPRDPALRAAALLYSPAAFIRHSVLPDPLDLEARGGEWILA